VIALWRKTFWFTDEGSSTVWPIFINEAAYYEKGIAMCLTQRQQINI
jgi:succinylglutamate desuccinylase